ncbi:hypothetical protein NE237_033291 [Protea cynaroides]|uniref:Uncharacterized protein n=1 Tax=Protea cynaroides TaxID=273540 RepID=A0A9Q0R4D8_9MAGN|nr:hypothetical protein NE237_033291 [Protea cynaroides]
MEKIKYELGSVALKVLIETIGFFCKTFSFLSSLTSDPLFSTVVAFYSLILLYLPRIFIDLVFSPVLISTAILLSTLLRLGATQSIQEQHNNKPTEQEEIDSAPIEDHKWVKSQTETESLLKPFFFASNPFVEWNVRAPLDVIYETYEGDEEGDSNGEKENCQMGIDRMLSLSLYFPETDSHSSSDGDFPEIEGWDEEDREGLIEIPLDGKNSSVSVFKLEEENLIEIDISLTPFGSQSRN